MWWCHACNAGFTTEYSADVPTCTRCGANGFVEFMPNAIPESLDDHYNLPQYDDDEDDGYDDDGDELYDTETLQNLFFNYNFFRDAGFRDRAASLPSSAADSPPPQSNGASEEAMDALPTVNLTAEDVANEPEVRSFPRAARPSN